jgi:hypothetical protein
MMGLLKFRDEEPAVYVCGWERVCVGGGGGESVVQQRDGTVQHVRTAATDGYLVVACCRHRAESSIYMRRITE